MILVWAQFEKLCLQVGHYGFFLIQLFRQWRWNWWLQVKEGVLVPNGWMRK